MAKGPCVEVRKWRQLQRLQLRSTLRAAASVCVQAPHFAGPTIQTLNPETHRCWHLRRLLPEMRFHPLVVLQTAKPQLRLVPKTEGVTGNMPGRRLAEGHSAGAGAWSLYAAGSAINGMAQFNDFDHLDEIRPARNVGVSWKSVTRLPGIADTQATPLHNRCLL